MESDAELVRRAQAALAGDLRAFEELVQQYQGRILANCRYLTRSPEDAEDLAQEVFIKAYFGLGKFEGRSEFRTWLYRIKVNHCLNFIKKRKGKTFLDIEDEGMENRGELRAADATDSRMAGLDDARLIQSILDAMPDTLRIPLILRDMDGLSYEDIASTLGIGLSAVKMRIKRGREEFRMRYGRAHPDRPLGRARAAADGGNRPS